MQAPPTEPRCATCRHYAPLSPGRAAICFLRWTRCAWNDAVPLVRADDGCDEHQPEDHNHVI